MTEEISEKRSDALPEIDGMMAAGNRLYCTTVDGNVIALGGQKPIGNKQISDDSAHGLREPTLTHNPFEGTLVEERHFRTRDYPRMGAVRNRGFFDWKHVLE